MIKALLIDMDGLLIDSEKCSFQVFVDFLKQYNIDFPIEFYAQNMCGHKAVENVKTIIDEYKLNVDFDWALKTIVDTEVAHFKAGIPCKKGARELLQFLNDNGYKAILATSSFVDRAMAVINFNDLDKYFDDKVFGVDVQKGKPNPDLFLKAAEKAGCKPEECLVLEDAETGIQAAYNGNIPVICVPDVKQPRQEYKDKCLAICNDLLQVIDYLKANN